MYRYTVRTGMRPHILFYLIFPLKARRGHDKKTALNPRCQKTPPRDIFYTYEYLREIETICENT